MIFISSENPNKMLRRADLERISYNVLTWRKSDHFILDSTMHIPDGFNPETDRAYGKNRTADYFMASPNIKISVIKAEEKNGEIVWYFEEYKNFSFSAVLSKSHVLNGLPKLRMILKPKVKAWFSVGYIGAPECSPNEVERYGKLYVALSNQSVNNQSVTLKFDPLKSFIDPAKEYVVKLWEQNKPVGKAMMRKGQITVLLRGKGITAMAIEGGDVKTKFQRKIFVPSEK